MRDVIVIGGGIIGLTTAWELSKRGLRVTVIDKGQPGREASWAGAGILPPGFPGDPRHPLATLCRLTHSLWPAFSAELRESTDIDNGFLACGAIELTPDGDEQSLQEEIRRWRGADVSIETLASSPVNIVEPALSTSAGPAFCLPELCQVRNPRHLKAVQMACVRNGVELRANDAVVAIERSGELVSGVRTYTERIPAGAVVVTAGAWSAHVLSSVGQHVPIEPIRGQIVLLRCNTLPVRHVIECGSRYLVPRPDGRILVGSTEERVGFDKRNTAAAIEGLLDFAVRLVPALADATFETAWAGLRPHAAGGLPFLGRIPGTSNLYVAAGHFRDGLNLSPITARLMSQSICGESTEVSLAPFDPAGRMTQG